MASTISGTAGMSGLLLTSTLMSFCGKTSMSVGQLRERLAGLEHGGQQLQGREDAVAGGVVVEEDHVARLLAAEHGAQALHVLEHVAVADLGGVVLEAVPLAGDA